MTAYLLALALLLPDDPRLPADPTPYEPADQEVTR